MPQEKNTLLRVVVPLAALLIGLGVAWSVWRNTARQHPAPPPVGARAPAAPGADGSASAAPPPEEAPPSAPDAASTTGEAPAPIEGLRARVVPADQRAPYVGLGEPLEDKANRRTQTPFLLRLEFAPIGAGLDSLHLVDHFESIREEEHVRLQAEHRLAGERPRVITPFAALTLEVNGTTVPIAGYAGAPVWRQVGPPESPNDAETTFEAIVEDGSGRPVVRITRTYRLRPGSHDFALEQRVENLTDGPLRVRWVQFGPADLPETGSGYGGDPRRVRFGYLLPPNIDPSRTVLGDKYATQSRASVLGKKGPLHYSDGTPRLTPAGEPIVGWPDVVVWPNPASVDGQFELVWAAMTNRYFGVATHTPVDPDDPQPDKVFRVVQTIDRQVLDNGSTSPATKAPPMILRYLSPVLDLAAGDAADLGMGVYAGPLSRRQIRGDPHAAAAGLEPLVVHNYGGPCAACTFTWLTSALLWLLLMLHDHVLFDWGLSIIVLVVMVRTILHPVTRWSQIRMQRFGKQMQAIAPKQKKIQERYKDDPQKLREETAKLWREEGISPTGMLGCLPMFLQTPVWIALFAMLYFAVELRHEPAFYGLFQAIVPGYPALLGWFLGDLSEPDRFWYFGRTLVNIPVMGEIRSLNLLPILLGVVFYIQQKYLTPPTSATLTPEQQQQQKIMKVMMVVMFPLFMYNAPSGLALYFIANSTLGIIESKWIRSHIAAEDLKKGPAPAGAAARRGRAPASGGGFLARLQQLAEQQRQAAAKRTPPGRRPGRER